MLIRRTIAALVAVLLAPISAQAADDGEIQKLRKEIEQLRQSDDARLQALEQRLREAESAAQPAARANAFNPAISLILSGLYTHLSQDLAGYRVSGFPVPPDVEAGPGARGFSLAESELGIGANIDPYFYGALNFSMHPDNTVSVEEAFIQTLALSHGFTVKFGRFFSGIGYLNEQHAHVWDFVDAPLAYQVFLGGQYGDDGVQARWIAPLNFFLEFGGELARGRSFPGSGRDTNDAGAVGAFVHASVDVGVSHSWRAGVSLLGTSPRDQSLDALDASGATVTNAFSGDTHIGIADFVWKYAPHGNASRTNFKLQGEYLQRRQDGNLVYNINGAATPGLYRATQSGGYLQAVYQFHPYWRVGVRTENLDYGNIDYGANGSSLARAPYDPTKHSIMVDFNLSEFSRFRLQYAQDRAREGVDDRQIFLQYQMSLGAHGAHNF